MSGYEQAIPTRWPLGEAGSATSRMTLDHGGKPLGDKHHGDMLYDERGLPG